MKLLNSYVSPFAARVRLAIYAYDMPVEIAPSGQWLPNFEKSPDYLAINPIGRVPTLIFDDGRALPESSVIVEFLADAFPGNALVPGTPEAAADARLVAHLLETYLSPRASPLFGQVFASSPDQREVERCVASMDEALSFVEHFLGSTTSPRSEALTIADCALVPYLHFFADLMVRGLGHEPIMHRHPRLADYWTGAWNLPLVQKLLGEMDRAIEASPLRRLVASEARAAMS